MQWLELIQLTVTFAFLNMAKGIERKNNNYCNTKGQTQVQQTTMESASKNIELCVYGNYYLLSDKNYDYFVAADNASWHCAIPFDSIW